MKDKRSLERASGPLPGQLVDANAQLAAAREDAARRCIEIVNDNRCSDCRHWDDRLTGALHCADEAIADIRREFGLHPPDCICVACEDAAREKGGSA